MDNNLTNKTASEVFDEYVFSEDDSEYALENETNEEYLARFNEERQSIKNPLRRFLFGKKYLFFCFIIKSIR